MIDPPYNIPIDGFVGGKGSVRHREFAHASGEMSNAEFLAFLAGFFTTALTTLIPGALVYAWMDWRSIDTLIAAGKQSGLSLLNLCVWAKTTAGMGSFYRSQHELCAVFKFGDEPHVNNVELGKHNRSRSNLWTARGMASFGRERNELLALHPTAKPVRLLADTILDASKRGDTVLDSSGQRLDLARLRRGRPALLRYRDRSLVCRCCRPALAEGDLPRCDLRGRWRDIRRAGRTARCRGRRSGNIGQFGRHRSTFGRERRP